MPRSAASSPPALVRQTDAVKITGKHRIQENGVIIFIITDLLYMIKIINGSYNFSTVNLAVSYIWASIGLTQLHRVQGINTFYVYIHKKGLKLIHDTHLWWILHFFIIWYSEMWVVLSIKNISHIFHLTLNKKYSFATVYQGQIKAARTDFFDELVAAAEASLT